MRPRFLLLLLLCSPPLSAGEAWKRVKGAQELRWGTDLTGGAPYIFRDGKDPEKVLGFEVDIMDALCKRLGVKSTYILVPWEQLVPALLRDDFDVAFNGLEITEERAEAIDFTIPYYFFSEQITVRKSGPVFRDLDGLRGHRVGTLSASLAQTMMDEKGGIDVVAYPSPVEIYNDLEIGRTEAALLDAPIAAWYAGPNPKLKNIGEGVGEGVYAGGLRKDSPELRSRMNEALGEMISNGELEAVYKKWNLWTSREEKLKDAVKNQATARDESRPRRYVPLLLKGAGMTVVLSLCAMVLAVLAGFALCLGKLYGPRPLGILSSTYIEVVRGTPLLIQLYLLYYGLPNIGLQLNAFLAAVLGLGLNYAAYEAEIYRAGLLSVPKGQDEAARSLGLTGGQSLWHVILPQAARTILPPSTNDFIALFKDTSLVSIITVTELTRAYNQAATATYRFLELGLMTAALYFLMSFPLSLWSRRMERKHSVALH